MLTLWYSSLYNISVSLCLLTYGGLEKYWQLWKKASLKNLLKTKWGQNEPYNYVVKKMLHMEKCPAGCGHVAIAQILAISKNMILKVNLIMNV